MLPLVNHKLRERQGKGNFYFVKLSALRGRDVAGLVAAGEGLPGEGRVGWEATVAALAFLGLAVEMILRQGDAELPAQVTFMLPAHLDHFWHLDAVWGLLNLVTQEMLQAGSAS